MTTTVGRGLAPRRAELRNGSVVVAQQTSMTPAVTISAAFRGGSLWDPPGLEGRAYLAGLVIDRGTVRRSAEVIAEELDDRGVSLKVSTNRQALTLSCTCLSEDFEDVLAIVADIVRHPVFPEGETARRRAEAVTTLRQREDNPAARAQDAAMDLLYSASHPYGRPAKGRVGSIERVTRADIAAFHRDCILPAALSLVVVGDVPAEGVVEQAAREFESWTGRVPAQVNVPSAPARTSREERFIDMPGKPQADIIYGFTTIRRTDPRYYAYWMMNNVLGQFGLGGRLAENIRERQGMAYYAFSTLDALPGEAPLLVRAGVDPANVERAVTAIEHEVATLGAEGPTAAEVEETRAYLVGSIPRMLETNQGIAAFLQSVEEFGLGLDFDRRLPALLNAVTLQEIRAAAAEVLDPGRAAVAIAGPAELRR